MRLRLDGNSLKWTEIKDILSGRAVTLSPVFTSAFYKSHKILKRAIESGEKIYGVNTGFGKLSDISISSEQMTTLQTNLVMSHSTAVGNTLAVPTAKLMLALRINSLLKGYSGVSHELITHMCSMANKNIIPKIPTKGSVGASGDLAPLAHMALSLIGEGTVWHKNRWMRADKALSLNGMKPYSLGPKEGLSLINGMQFTLAWLFEQLAYIEKIADLAEVAAAMTIDALLCSKKPFENVVSESRAHDEISNVCKNMLRNLKNSEINESHTGCSLVQDNYAIRCIPQIHAVVRSVFNRALDICLKEANATTDNPLITNAGRIISAGNFHGQPLAQCADEMRIALSTLSNIIERRIDLLLNPPVSDLPPFLSPKPGLQSGLMTVQILAASLAAENRVLSSPASNQSIPTTGGKEDIVSMAPISVSLLAQQIENIWLLIASELICACEGLERRRPLKSSRICEKMYTEIRKRVKKLTDDRPLSSDIQLLALTLKTDSIDL